MCLIIDTNVFGSVFNKNSKYHEQFEPVLNWIVYGKGKVVYGGDKYINEMVKANYVGLFKLLSRSRKVIRLPDQRVNEIQNDLESKNSDPKFNDPHIVSIVIASKCKIVCTEDRESHAYIKDPSLYPKGTKPPKIYSNKSHKYLLNDNNIADICTPCQKTKSSDIKILEKTLNN